MLEKDSSKKQKVKIITDSTSDISSATAKPLNIEVIPLKLLIDENTYLDGVDITPREFYQRLPTLEKIPTTSQPTPDEFAQMYEKNTSEGMQ